MHSSTPQALQAAVKEIDQTQMTDIKIKVTGQEEETEPNSLFDKKHTLSRTMSRPIQDNERSINLLS